jgi:hypothetical protein
MTDTPDPQDDQAAAEDTDADEIDAADFPPERSLGVDDLLDDDVTAAGGYAPDNLRTRLRREDPEARPAGDGDDAAPAPRLTGPGEPAEDDWEIIDPGGVLSDSTAAAHGTDTWPAEEAALHIVDDDEVT